MLSKSTRSDLNKRLSFLEVRLFGLCVCGREGGDNQRVAVSGLEGRGVAGKRQRVEGQGVSKGVETGVRSG